MGKITLIIFCGKKSCLRKTYYSTSSNTPPKQNALLPGATAQDNPHLGEGRAPDCLALTHFHLAGMVSSLTFPVEIELDLEWKIFISILGLLINFMFVS